MLNNQSLRILGGKKMIQWCPHCMEWTYVNPRIGAIKICYLCGMAILPDKKKKTKKNTKKRWKKFEEKDKSSRLPSA
jgi:hypothetical protein